MTGFFHPFCLSGSTLIESPAENIKTSSALQVASCEPRNTSEGSRPYIKTFKAQRGLTDCRGPSRGSHHNTFDIKSLKNILNFVWEV